MYRKAHTDTTKPIMVEMRNGALVNEVIPSSANENRRLKFHDESPARRSPWSNSTSFLLKPIQLYIPLV